MFSFRYQLTQALLIFILFISLIQSYRINELDNDKLVDHDQPIDTARQHGLQQILARRSFYDPAFSDSWSNYFERKRRLFDPAYSDWANSFKRSSE